MAQQAYQFISSLRALPHTTFQRAQAYHQTILEKPEQSRQRALILTVALAVIGAISTGIALKVRSLNVIPFTVISAYSFVPMLLIYTLDREPKTEVDEALAKDHRTMMQAFLIGLAVIGGIGTAVEMSNFSGFSALFALVAGVATAALWHTEGMQVVHLVEQE